MRHVLKYARDMKQRRKYWETRKDAEKQAAKRKQDLEAEEHERLRSKVPRLLKEIETMNQEIRDCEARKASDDRQVELLKARRNM